MEVKINKGLILEGLFGFGKEYHDGPIDKDGNIHVLNPEHKMQDIANMMEHKQNSQKNFYDKMDKQEASSDDILDYVNGHMSGKMAHIGIVNSTGEDFDDSTTYALHNISGLNHHINTIADNYNSHPEHYGNELNKIAEKIGKEEYEQEAGGPEAVVQTDWLNYKIEKPKG